ncbi:hypothetical protein [Mesobacillus jeotgali]|uniref:hypothetical protein n=1 Tax=Mesobacillus jeotgali TaxID=129985 RepID=UPI000C831E41|nr:hypothetical protein [Mesobacillus jeotgali]
MNLTRWSYTKRYNIKAEFDVFPNSVVIFRQIKDYYFVYTVNWSLSDPVVTKTALGEMEWLLNKELGTLENYSLRKIYQNHSD